MSGATNPSRLLVEVSAGVPDPLATVRHILLEAGVISAGGAKPARLRLDFGPFIHVELCPEQIAAAIMHLEASSDVVSVTPEPDAEP